MESNLPTPKQALNVLLQAAFMAPLNMKDNDILRLAAKTLGDFIGVDEAKKDAVEKIEDGPLSPK